MFDMTVAELIGFGFILSLVVVATISLLSLCDSFKRDLELGLYSSSLPGVDENRIQLFPEHGEISTYKFRMVETLKPESEYDGTRVYGI